MVSSAAIDTAPGMPSGAGASGQAGAAYGREVDSQPVLLLSCPVDSRLGDRARIGVYHSCPTTALAGIAREIQPHPRT